MASHLDDSCRLTQTTDVTVIHCDTKYYVYKTADLVMGMEFYEEEDFGKLTYIREPVTV